MEISNGFVRTISGKWVNINRIQHFDVRDDEVWIYLNYGDSSTYCVDRFDNEVQAQTQLDQLMRSKWN